MPSSIAYRLMGVLFVLRHITWLVLQQSLTCYSNEAEEKFARFGTRSQTCRH